VLGHVKGSLGIDRDIQADIDTTMEEYHIAVTRRVADNLYGKLPCELRDMVYQYLVPDKFVLCNGLCHPEPHTYESKYDEDGLTPYISDSPRTKNDPICLEHFWRDAAVGPIVAQELM
jgi:hypothetical protein